jgi:hypothetical protein
MTSINDPKGIFSGTIFVFLGSTKNINMGLKSTFGVCTPINGATFELQPRDFGHCVVAERIHLFVVIQMLLVPPPPPPTPPLTVIRSSTITAAAAFPRATALNRQEYCHAYDALSALTGLPDTINTDLSFQLIINWRSTGQEPLKPRTNVSCRFLKNQLAICF